MSSSRPAFLRCLRMLPTMRSSLSQPRSRQYWKRALWSDPFPDLSASMRYVDRQMRDMDREMQRVFDNLDRFTGGPRVWLKGRGRGEDWPSLHLSFDDAVKVAPDGSRKFQMRIDVAQFKPEEVKVNIKERVLTVSAKHEEKTADGGKIFQEFSRQYLLPEDMKTEEVRCSYSADGVLGIEAPLPAIEPPQEREIPVEIENGDKKKA